jgi:magnesium transporter
MNVANVSPPDPLTNLPGAHFHTFTELLGKPVCVEVASHRLGKLGDLAFELKEPYPEAVGLYLDFGWGKPTQFIPWSAVTGHDEKAIYVKTPESGPYPPFQDQPGWMLVEQHLLGRTILDLDGRRVEVVNDVQLLEAKGRLLLIHVDTSLNGLLRRWGLRKAKWFREQLISWKVVQPLSIEDAMAHDRVTLSVTRSDLKEMPSEDLADALEELTGREQEALFSALDSEKAAETLIEAEPRAQRQLIGLLLAVRHEKTEWKERARKILAELSVPQLSTLFAVLPHDDVHEILGLLPGETEVRLRRILATGEPKAEDLISSDYVTVSPTETAGDILARIRRSGREPREISYLYTVTGEDSRLEGVVDLRALVLAADSMPVGEISVSPLVTAGAEETQEDLAETFKRYHYRMLPVVDGESRILGVIRYDDIMSGRGTGSRERSA